MKKSNQRSGGNAPQSKSNTAKNVTETASLLKFNERKFAI